MLLWTSHHQSPRMLTCTAISTVPCSGQVPMVLPVVTQNHSVIIVTMPPAAGFDLSVTVTVGGQGGTLHRAWSFDPPVIREVAGYSFFRGWKSVCL